MTPKLDTLADKLRELGWRAVPVSSLNGSRWQSPYGDISCDSVEEAAKAAGLSSEGADS